MLLLAVQGWFKSYAACITVLYNDNSVGTMLNNVHRPDFS